MEHFKCPFKPFNKHTYVVSTFSGTRDKTEAALKKLVRSQFPLCEMDKRDKTLVRVLEHHCDVLFSMEAAGELCDSDLMVEITKVVSVQHVNKHPSE